MHFSDSSRFVSAVAWRLFIQCRFYTPIEPSQQNLPGTVQFPPAYVELKKAAKDIKRPYRSPTLALISQCRTLANVFSKDEARKSVNFETLET